MLAGITFVRFPLTFIVTLRVRVQLVLAGRNPPLNVNELFPGVPDNAPPHVPVFKFGGLARNIPTGIVSVKPIPTKSVLFGLINSTLMVDAEPPKTVSGSKPLTIPMERSATVIEAVAESNGLITVPVPCISPLTFVGGIVFVRVTGKPLP